MEALFKHLQWICEFAPSSWSVKMRSDVVAVVEI